jgi:hypothetical protein
MVFYANDLDLNLAWPGDWSAGRGTRALEPAQRASLLEALGGCSLGAERAVEALYALQAILQERRERECAARGADAAAAPEPCGAVRMPSAADRAVGRALVWVAKRVGGYYAESSLCRRV